MTRAKFVILWVLLGMCGVALASCRLRNNTPPAAVLETAASLTRGTAAPSASLTATPTPTLTPSASPTAATRTPPATLDPSEWIAYSDQATLNIHVVEASGARLTDVTHVKPYDVCSYPNWSPDGLTLAYACYTLHNSDIYVSGPEGENPRRLTNSPRFETKPVWSPDGKMIAFTSYPDDMAWELDVLRLDDRNTTRVAAGRATDYGFIETGYSWSPDSKTLAFYDVATDQLFTVNADGTGLEELTTPEMGTGNREPAWSPNADEIAYSAAGGLMLVSPRDHVERPLLADYTLYKPVWSPNGQFVASESSSEQGGIHFVEAATRKAWGWLDGQTVLDQAWAPDSVHIAYIGEEDNHGNFALFILDIFSGETRRLIELDPPMFSAIAWQP